MKNERFPRTLSEAFGPHISDRIDPAPLTSAEIANRELNRLGVVALVLLVAGIVCIAWGSL